MMLKKHRSPVRRIFISIALVGAVALPLTASAYLNPEDVLLNTDFYAPPRTRETSERVRQQQRESAQRRESEWEEEYEQQHPALPEPEEEIFMETDEVPPVSDAEIMELLRTIRLLERVDAHQDALRHSGALPLAPTGAGGIIAMLTMLGAVGLTLYKAGKRKGWSTSTKTFR